MFFPSVRTGSR